MDHFTRFPYIEQKRKHTEYDYIFLSPHLDDAVLSCSGLIGSLQGSKILVITLFAGDPTPPYSAVASSFHQLWRVHDGSEAYVQRKKEERQAMAFLGVDFAWLGWLDSIYRLPLGSEQEICDPTAILEVDPVYQQLLDWMADLFSTFSKACIFIPMSIGDHRDHRLPFFIAQAIGGKNIVFYEDFPYVAFHMSEVSDFAYHYHLGPICIDISAFLQYRIEATQIYQSQLDMLCHPPKKIEDVIYHYCHEEQGTFVERYWISVPTK